VDKLKRIAAKKKITTNALVSQILESFLEWEMSAVEAGWIVMPKPFLIDFLKELEDKTITDIVSKQSKNIAKDIAHHMKGKHDLEEWLSIIRARSKRSGFNLTEHQRNNDLVIIMQHDMGKKWSVYFKTFYESIFHDLGVKTNFDYTDNSIIMKLHKVPEHILNYT
jgi:hypothetical protein